MADDRMQAEETLEQPEEDDILAAESAIAENGSDVPAEKPKSRIDELDDRPWLTSLWRPFLITVLAGCLVVAFVAFVRRLVPELPAIYTQLLVVIGLITAVIGCVSTTWLAQPRQRSSRTAGYRVAEFVFILVFTRIAIWAATGSWPGFDLILRPLDALLDGYFVVGMIAVMLAWIMATAMTEDMIGMGLRPDDIYMARTYTDKWQDTARPVYTDRPAILRRFTGRWVAGGVLLVIMAAGSRFAAPRPGFFLPIIGQNIDRAVIIAAIVYFLAGLALISQGQLALLRARWTLQKTPSAPGVLQNWPIYALVLILLVGGIAALMPLGGTFHLALILSTIIEVSYWLVMQFFGLIVGLFLLLASLFAGAEQPQETPTPAPTPVMTPEPMAEPPPALPPWTGGTIFWIVAALLLGYVAYIYFGGRGFTFGWLHQLWAMIVARWRQMAGAYRQWQATHVRNLSAEGDTQAGRRRRRLLSWLGYRGLDADAQVRYYYLSLLEEAEQAGHPRRAAETPSDYAPRLAYEIRETDVDGEAIYALTDAFVRVRYAKGHFDAEDASRLRALWNQLRRLLRL